MTADDVKIAFGRELLCKYDWEGATVPLDHHQRGSDMPQFYCGRCNAPVVWEPTRKPCFVCDPVRALLRDAIAVARQRATPPLPMRPGSRIITEGEAVESLIPALQAANVRVAEMERDWNTALLALGREWYSQILTYAPEEQHEVRKAIYALWRGDGIEDSRRTQQENRTVCDAISAGLEKP